MLSPRGQVFLAWPPLPCLLSSPGAFHQIPGPTGALAQTKLEGLLVTQPFRCTHSSEMTATPMAWLCVDPGNHWHPSWGVGMPRCGIGGKLKHRVTCPLVLQQVRALLPCWCLYPGSLRSRQDLGIRRTPAPTGAL